jgi:CO dehydrogenase/acetyl-CoA synthase beta subunit
MQYRWLQADGGNADVVWHEAEIKKPLIDSIAKLEIFTRERSLRKELQLMMLTHWKLE